MWFVYNLNAKWDSTEEEKTEISNFLFLFKKKRVSQYLSFNKQKNQSQYVPSP